MFILTAYPAKRKHVEDKELEIKAAEEEILRGKQSLDSIKAHYAAEIENLRKKKEELERYHDSIVKLKSFVSDNKEHGIKIER